MPHRSSPNRLLSPPADPSVLAIQEVVVKFHGVNAHAAGNPEDGVNALDAVIQAFNAIAAMRQQMKQTWRVHGIILKGGTKPNIIPDLTVTEWYAREHQRFPAPRGRRSHHHPIHVCLVQIQRRTQVRRRRRNLRS